MKDYLIQLTLTSQFICQHSHQVINLTPPDTGHIVPPKETDYISVLLYY